MPRLPTPEGLVERALQRMGIPQYRELLSSQKELIWIEGATQRFEDGNNWFGRILARY